MCSDNNMRRASCNRMRFWNWSGLMAVTARKCRWKEGALIPARFQALAFEQGIVSEVQHVIAFVIGQVPFEQLQPTIDLLGQAEPLAHQVDCTDAAVADRPAPFDHLKVDVTGTHHRLFLFGPPTLSIQAPRHSLLAVTQDFRIRSFHSKCLFSLVWLA
jgi:hypothetical protein